MTCHVDGPLLYTNRTPYYRRSPTQKAPKSSPPRGWTGIAFSLSAATVVACELQQSCENDAIGTCERWDISRPVWRLALSTRGPSGAPHPAARPTAPGTDSAGAEIEAVLKAKLLPVQLYEDPFHIVRGPYEDPVYRGRRQTKTLFAHVRGHGGPPPRPSPFNCTLFHLATRPPTALASHETVLGSAVSSLATPQPACCF
jgi:hypothetical protein